LRFAEEQLVVLLLLEQETVPMRHVAVAVQRAFSSPIRGCLAAKRTWLASGEQEPETGGPPRIAASASRVSGGWLGVWAKLAAEVQRKTQARIQACFIRLSFGLFLQLNSYHAPITGLLAAVPTLG
jgi:hypothetical protein